MKARLREAFHGQIKTHVDRRLSPVDRAHVSTEVGGQTFLSPVHRWLNTAVELDVLLLVPPARRLVGDPDNRLKTLIDGLTRPANDQQMQGHVPPSEGGPTYCLMDDDGLVKRLSVDSRRWFEPTTEPQEALVVVTATLVLDDDAGLTSQTANLILVL